MRETERGGGWGYRERERDSDAHQFASLDGRVL